MQKTIIHKSRYARYFLTVYHLICRDLRIFKEEFWGKCIDTAIQLFTTVIIFSYFLPAYGLASNYGSFILVGVIASFGFFEVMGRVSLMIADLEGDRTILYNLALPIPAWLVFVYFGISWAILSSIISLMLFPLGKLVLFSQFDLGQISVWKFVIIFILSNLFFGFFALWLSSLFKKMSSLSHLFVRVVNPMYMFGGYLYSWAAVYELSHVAGYLHLLNPLIYVMEGMRSAALGPSGYLPFGLSVGALMISIGFFAWDAIRRLSKRLDCIERICYKETENAIA